MNLKKKNDIKVARCYSFNFIISITDSNFDNTLLVEKQKKKKKHFNKVNK